MASTPIYNWPTPDNTDLVKNGALAIRTLGDAIDTTVDTMIPETIFAAKGDLLGASANDTPAVLTVGANGETLVADSSTSTGLRYTAGTVQANPILNSAFQVWQRGTSFAASGSGAIYTADRWQFLRNSLATGATASRQTVSDTTNLPNIQYSMRLQRDSGNTSTATIFATQSLETVNSIPFAGKTITLSFYARAGANFSGSGFNIAAYYGTGTDQNITGTYTGITQIVNPGGALTTTWQRFTATGTVATTATELALQVNWAPSGTAGANDWAEFTGVQIDIGSVALPFRTYAGTIQGELAACQRYYWRVVSPGAYATYGQGYTISTTGAYVQINFPSPMRVYPTSVDFSTLAFQPSTGTITALSSVSLDQGTNLSMTLAAITASTWAASLPGRILNNNSSSGYLGFSAEL
jgi:hypothetical protein